MPTDKVLELKKFALDKAILTTVKDVEGNIHQANVLDSAKAYYNWMIGNDDETPAVNA